MTRQQTTGGVRVLFVSDHFGHAGGVIHGATRYFLTVLPRLQQNGVELSAAFLREPHPAADRLREQGVEPRFFGRAKWNPLTVTDVWRVLKRERIEVIHAAGMKGILTARIAGRIAGVPVIAHLHDCMPVSPALARPLRWTSGWAAHTLAVSREVASFACETLNIDPAGTEVLANGHPLIADEPVSVGGTNTGPSPYELLTAALGACTSMTLRMYADRKGWPLEAAEVRLEHSKIHCVDCAEASKGRPKIDHISRELVLEGPLDEAQQQRLLEIADRCPVHRTLHSEIKVTTTLAEE